MQCKLKEIASIRTGFTFREPPRERENAPYRVLNIKEVRQVLIIDPGMLTAFDWETKARPPLLEPGEVVLVARGEHNVAALFMGGGDVVPSSQLLVLTIKDRRKVIPEFLCWLLNQPEAEKYFDGERRGSGIQSINKAVVEAMVVKVPRLEVQHKIVEIVALLEKEKQLTEQLRLNRELEAKFLFQKLLE